MSILFECGAFQLIAVEFNKKNCKDPMFCLKKKKHKHRILYISHVIGENWIFSRNPHSNGLKILMMEFP